MSTYRFRRRLLLVSSSPGGVMVASFGSLLLIGIAPVVCAG